MSRGKRIILEKNIGKDRDIEIVKNVDPEHIKEMYMELYNNLSSSVYEIYEKARSVYNEEKLGKMGLLSVQQAYEYLREHNYDISFRAFGGRLERGVIPSIRIGRKRYIHVNHLNLLLQISRDFYSVKEAYEVLKKYDPSLNYRAFIGRVEKKSIPSVKLGFKRYLPKDVVNALGRILKRYCSISQAMKRLKEAGVKLKRNAFERRIDRNRIPHVKLGGKRYIPIEAIDELIRKEIGN